MAKPTSMSTTQLGNATAALLLASVAAWSGCRPAEQAHVPATSSERPISESSSDQPAESSSAPVAEAPHVLSDEQLREGWIALFDGDTLFGWEPDGEATWSIGDGEIRVAGDKPGLLRTTTEFGDYQFHLEFKASEDAKGAVYLQAPSGELDPPRNVYAVAIAPPTDPFPTGSLIERSKAGDTVKADDWHQLEVTVRKDQVSVSLDGTQLHAFRDANALGRGHVALGFESGNIAFRELRLRPLGLEERLPDKDLAGWRPDAETVARFEITNEGHLHVSGGPGQLELTDSYGDFVLQLECMTHASDQNSGIFFRCIPGDRMMGYESQISNAFENGDRRKAVDCGTGGIFRRQNARLVVPDDKQWFHKTIVAHGPHIAVWVNGYQVVDWTDDRPPHENPRKGLRLEPGTLMIQAHDPTTDLSFRAFRIVELPQRTSPGGNGADTVKRGD